MNGAAQTKNTPSAVSAVRSATDTQTHDYDPHVIINTIRSGGKNIRARVEAIRKTWRSELDKHGDIKLAKGAIDSAKKQLPAVVWAGTFTERANDKLVNSSGLLGADLDNLGTRLKEVREKLTCSPYPWAVFLSPSGDGLKVVFRVPADQSKHSGSFLAIEQYVKEMAGVQVDQSCKDVARLCFLSYDPQVFHNPGAIEIEPLPEPEKPQYVNRANIDLSARQRVVNEILVQVDWESETSGFTTCPGKHLHTTGDNDRDCKVDLDQVPTLHCFHNSCRGILDGVNHEVRSRIGKAECGERPPADSDNSRSQTKTDNDESPQEKKEKLSPWAKAKDAPTLLAEPDKEITGLAKDLIIPGTITLMASPRGLGKSLSGISVAFTMALGGYFRSEHVEPMRVFLVDRDNPKKVVKDRLRGFGASEARNLKVLTREEAPDLQDKKAWEIFPVSDYDVVIIDSMGSFTEGITEKEGKETTKILATVLDLIHRGPAVLLLANCTKDALNVKGRGEWMDRVDIVYEVRDATAFTPSGKKDWWLELPEAGESAWGDRAARRKNRADYRLAFIPSKFRLGAQPDPFCLELRLPKDELWSLHDVTADLIETGENVIKESAAKKEQKEKAAVDALADVVGTRHAEKNPILKTEAQDYLHGEMEISRDRARELVKVNAGVRWNLEHTYGKGNTPQALIPINQSSTGITDKSSAKIGGFKKNLSGAELQTPFSAGHAQSGPQKYLRGKSISAAGSVCSQEGDEENDDEVVI